MEADGQPQCRCRHGGLTTFGWNSGEPQKAGMWFQVELPDAVSVAELQFDAAAGGRLGGGGGGRAQPATGQGAQGQGGAASALTAADGFDPQSGRGAGPAAAPRPVPGFPREYQVQLSLDGKDWGNARRDGAGQSAHRRFTESDEGEIHPDHPDWIDV